MLSERGQPLLVFENYKFRKYRDVKSTEEVVWRCTKKNCMATIYTLNAVFSKKCGEHNHEANEALLSRQKINNVVKRKAQEDISTKPSKLIRSEMRAETHSLETLSVTDIKCIRNNINHARLLLVPKLPKSTMEVQHFLHSSNLRTSTNEPFLMCNDFLDNIVIFSCEKNLEFMCQQDLLYMDGTFEYCTKYFGQLFTIHAYAMNFYVPVVFCLLKDKKKSTYSRVFQLLIEKCTLLGYVLNPSTVIIDFEVAIHASLQEIFPEELKIIGCRFHLAQSW